MSFFVNASHAITVVPILCITDLHGFSSLYQHFAAAIVHAADSCAI
jgi:hypothetical protein